MSCVTRRFNKCQSSFIETEGFRHSAQELTESLLKDGDSNIQLIEAFIRELKTKNKQHKRSERSQKFVVLIKNTCDIALIN